MKTNRLEKLEGLKHWYDQRAQAFVGPGFIEKAMSVPGADFVLETLEGFKRPVRVAELGMGFSTVFLADWLHNWSEHGGELWSMEHDERWLSFMRVVGVDFGLPLERMLVRHQFLKSVKYGTFDVVIVDHGPELQTRKDDMPWIVKLAGEDGVLLFDDWRPKHEGRIRDALRKNEVEGDWVVGSAEHTRRYPTDKAIGILRRRK